jgi:hypothetical protein
MVLVGRKMGPSATGAVHLIPVDAKATYGRSEGGQQPPNTSRQPHGARWVPVVVGRAPRAESGSIAGSSRTPALAGPSPKPSRYTEAVCIGVSAACLRAGYG